MADELIVTPKGLTTNPSQILAGGGGLSECTNALCRRPGIVEPRGAFAVVANSAIASGGLTVTTGVTSLNGTKYIVASNNSTASAIIKGADYTNRLGLSQANTTPRFAPVGQSLALALNGGIRMIDSTSGDPSTTAARFMGVPRPIGWFLTRITLGSSLDWLATGYVTAYRAVWRRQINGRDYRSAPTDRKTVFNASGSSVYVYHRIPVTSEHVGWYLDIYRTPTQVASGTQPSDEMRLRTSIKITSGMAGTGYVEFSDYAGDSSWSGAALYTNATQEGIQNANAQPGDCTDIASYSGMTFLAGHRTGGRVTLGLKSVGANADGSCTLSSVAIAGSTTTGSKVITGVAADVFPKLAVGQVVTLASNYEPGTSDATFDAYCTISSWSSGSSTITVSINAKTTGAVNAIAWDWVKVAGTNASRIIWAGWPGMTLSNYQTSDYIRTNGVFCSSDAGTAGGIQANVSDMERAFGSLGSFSDAYTSNQLVCWTSGGADSPTKGCTVTFAEVLSYDTGGQSQLGAATFTVTSSKPDAWSLSVDTSTGVTSAVDGSANRIAWSKLGEPEAFPLAQYVNLGSQNNTIDRIVATSNVLFVFTREGLYRGNGTTPENLDFDLLDPTCRTSSERAGWVTKYGDTAFAWTSRGVIAATNMDVQNVDNAINDITRSYPDVLSTYTTEGTYSAADEINGLVLFGARSTTGNVPICYVYCTQSGTWQSFSPSICGTRFTLSAAATDRDGSLLVGTSGQSGYATYIESPIRDVTASDRPYRYDYYDTSGSYTDPALSAFSGNTFTISTGSSVADVAIGDAILIGVGTLPYYVTDVAGTTVTVDRTVSPTAATGTVLKAYTSTVTYVASAEGMPMVEKRYTDLTLDFGVIRFGRNYTLSTGRFGETSTTSQTIVYDTDLTGYAGSVKAMATRRSVPTAQGRGVALKLTFSQRQAASYWQLMSARVLYEPITDKINRGQS